MRFGNNLYGRSQCYATKEKLRWVWEITLDAFWGFVFKPTQVTCRSALQSAEFWYLTGSIKIADHAHLAQPPHQLNVAAAAMETSNGSRMIGFRGFQALFKME